MRGDMEEQLSVPGPRRFISQPNDDLADRLELILEVRNVLPRVLKLFQQRYLCLPPASQRSSVRTKERTREKKRDVPPSLSRPLPRHNPPRHSTDPPLVSCCSAPRSRWTKGKKREGKECCEGGKEGAFARASVAK
jgi:hypothetical protein